MPTRPRKPKIFPGVIICDTREQSPFPFRSIDPWDEIPMKYAALATGDYSLVGYESVITIERKSVSDWYGSIGADRERFTREMERLAEMRHAAVVIEGDWNALTVDRPATIQMSAKSSSHTMLSWSLRYGVHFWPCLNRRHAELVTFHLLRHFLKQEMERRKAEGGDGAGDAFDGDGEDEGDEAGADLLAGVV
jgi:ERCC4-type nuclease